MFDTAAPAKIAVFMPSLNVGGAEQVMVTLANGFTKRGFIVDLVLATREGRFLDHVSPDVRIVDLGRRRVLSSLLPLASYLRRERPAVLLSALSYANVVALLANLRAGCVSRVVVSERTSFQEVKKHHKGLSERVVRLMMRLSYRRADAVTVVSKAAADELIDALALDRGRVHYIPNPIVSPTTMSRAEELPQHPWARDSELPLIVAVGRLAPEKGFDTLLRAFARLVERQPSRLLILGEGPLRKDLESLVRRLSLERSVALPGSDPNPLATMKRASLFALTSRLEGMPGALIQAMACGTPVVATDCRTGPREILEGGRWGRLVAVDDVEGLANAMASTLAEKVRPDVQQRATHFSEEASVQQYLRALGLVA